MSDFALGGARRRALAVITGLGLMATALPAVSAVSVEDSAVPTAVAAASLSDGQYIVVLKDAPVAINPGTRPEPGRKLQADSSAARTYTEQLRQQQDSVLADIAAEPNYRYTTVLNGFAVALTATEAAAVATRPDVRSVTKDTKRELLADDDQFRVTDSPAQPDTDVSPDLLGLRGPGGVWEQLGGIGRAGAGTVVGVIDSGTDWRSPSFDPAGMPAPPSGFGGDCNPGADPARWPVAQACNDKNLSGEFFIAGFDAAGATLDPADSRSPFNTDTHGTHVASTAVGREVGLTDGTNNFDIAGMAPASHLATYKVCWLAETPAQTGCYPQDSIAAIDSAVADGVDVINFSVSGDPNTYEDPVDLAFKNAAAAGVFVSSSAGNSARDGVPVVHIGPWMTSVGAAAHRPGGGPVPSIASFSGRGPVGVPAADQTILKPDVGAPGVNVLAAAVNADGSAGYGYLSGTSMSSPHIAGLAALQVQANPDFSPMAIKSSLTTGVIDYAGTGNDPFVGGNGFVEPRTMLDPGLVFDSDEADWDAFLADPSTGTELNTASVSIPQLGPVPTTVTRTVTNVSDGPLTYTASVDGPATLAVVVSPQVAVIPAGASIDVTITVANVGAPETQWQKAFVTWATTGDASDVRIPLVARGEASMVEPDPTVDRVGGDDRYDTAAKIARLYPDGTDVVYVATGNSYYDALAGAAPASRGLVPGEPVITEGEPAPVLLVKTTSVPDFTQAVLDEIDPADIVILGGEKVVTQDVVDVLNETTTANVRRVGGDNRYETAALLAAEYGSSDTVYIATGEEGGFPDALSGSALAGSEGAPVLLTKKNKVPDVVASTIAELGATNIIVLGGPNAITDTTFNTLGGTARLAGDTRYETSVAISKAFGYGDGIDAPVTHVATGETFPDALAASSLAGFQDAPVMLVKGPDARDQVPDTVLDELNRISPDQVFILGGTRAVSQEVEIELNMFYPGWRAD
ncbi:MAG: cell wall-binding repeat-containing protein [Ornithinimicrobium sp.]